MSRINADKTKNQFDSSSGKMIFSAVSAPSSAAGGSTLLTTGSSTALPTGGSAALTTGGEILILFFSRWGQK
jgi:hypothetical protein